MLGCKAEDLICKNNHTQIQHSHADGCCYSSLECPIFAAFRVPRSAFRVPRCEVRHVEDEVFWHKDGVAQLLDVKPTTLASRIKKLGITRYQYVGEGSEVRLAG